jgi:hypothetical protein
VDLTAVVAALTLAISIATARRFQGWRRRRGRLPVEGRLASPRQCLADEAQDWLNRQ